MKNLIYILCLIPTILSAQFEVENIGLKNKSITSLKINYGILAVGTNQNGVYWTQEGADSITWNHIDLEKKDILTVYPHKSGPLGWAIGSGIQPDSSDTNFIYCSFLGQEAKYLSYGIDTNYTHQITKLDGFPDPTICGETFASGGRILYRRLFGDSVWHPVYTLSIEGNFNTVKANLSNGIVMAGGGEGFANQLLIKTFDKGNNWDLMSPLINVQNIDFSDDDSAKTIFVSDNYRILESDDYGKTWEEIFNNDEFNINDILFNPSQNILFACGWTNMSKNGIIYFKYLNSDAWDQIPYNFISPVVDIDNDFDNWIYVATADSGIFRFRYSVDAVNEDNSDLPNKIQLYQNYPNPFNPTTTIKYSLPKDVKYEIQDVRIKIYDIIGREINTLVNRHQKPGTYTVEFDGSNLASGIYYYQIKIGSLISTKKMILLR